MKQRQVKKIFLYLLGTLAGAINLYGWHPVAIGYFGALSGVLGKAMPAFAAVFFGLLWKANYIDVIRYGISMLLFIILCGMRKKNEENHKIQMAFLCGLSLLTMNITRYLLVNTDKIQLMMGTLESIFAGALAVLFSAGMDWILRPSYKTEHKKQLQGEHLKETAHTLEKLSGCFEKLPVKKEMLSDQDMEEMFNELVEKVCYGCERYEACWERFYQKTCQAAYSIFSEIENSNETSDFAATTELAQSCQRYRGLIKEARQIFEKTKNNFLWYNRLIENRSAVALQLNEMARMMANAADEIDSRHELEDELANRIRKKLKMHQVLVTEMSKRQGRKGREELCLTMRAAHQSCIPIRDIAGYLSEVLQKQMEADKESRLILNENEETIVFRPKPNYKALYGTAKVAKCGERIAGDNFSVCFNGGQMAACLSDGMGSGLLASQASELVLELLESFLEAGFCKETALCMMNSMLVMNGQNGQYSTVDMAEVDLFAGVCEFVKMGAALSFIKRETMVETVKLESFPVGSFYDQEFESATKMLYDGDYVIMVSDGVLSALPSQIGEQVMCQLIEKLDCINPKEMANRILEQALTECGYEPPDDMTALVFTLRKNY